MNTDGAQWAERVANAWNTGLRHAGLIGGDGPWWGLQDFLLTPTFVWTACLVIVGAGSLYAGRLRLTAGKLRKMLLKLHEEVQKSADPPAFHRNWEAYTHSATTQLGEAWNEFVETLILPEPGEEKQIIRNTSEARRHLNDQTVIFEKIPFRLYDTVPNLLSGAGILCTFLGLAAGVGAAGNGLSSGDTTQMQSALERLLSGASLAFWTSVCGLGASMTFLAYERRWNRRLHITLVGWTNALDKRMEIVTPQSVALEQLRANRAAARELQEFNTDLAVQIESALEERVADKLIPQLKAIASAIDGVRSDQAADTSQLITKALDRFADELRGRAGAEFDGMKGVLGELVPALDGVAASLNNSQEQSGRQMREIASTVARTMEDGAQATRATVDAAVEALAEKMAGTGDAQMQQMLNTTEAVAAEMRRTAKEIIEEMTDAAAKAAEDAQSQAEKTAEIHNKGNRDALDRLISRVDEHDAALRDRIGGMLADIAATNRGTVGDLGAAASELTNTVRKAARDVEQTISEMNANAAERGREAATTLTGATTRLEATSGALNAAAERNKNALDEARELAETTGELIQRINALPAKLEETYGGMRATADRLTRAADRSAEAADAGRAASETFAGAAEETRKSAADFQRCQAEVTAAWQEYRERFQGIDENAVKLFDEFEAGVVRWIDRTKRFTEELDDKTAEMINNLSAATKGLADAIEDLSDRRAEPNPLRRVQR